MNNRIIFERLDHLIHKGIEACKNPLGERTQSYVSDVNWYSFETSAFKFLQDMVGNESPYFKGLEKALHSQYVSNILAGVEILKAIKIEIENGWMTKIKSIVSAEIFSDFLEMAKYLTEQGFKDAAAVIFGSTLESHLKKVGEKLNVELTFENSKGETIPKKADRLNADLLKAGAYNILDQKNITAWLELRNKAAHGQYD